MVPIFFSLSTRQDLRKVKLLKLLKGQFFIIYVFKSNFEVFRTSAFISQLIQIKLYAVEKNPSAVFILKRRNATQWANSVTVISSDMRDWKPDQKLDIIISELLGILFSKSGQF